MNQNKQPMIARDTLLFYIAITTYIFGYLYASLVVIYFAFTKLAVLYILIVEVSASCLHKERTKESILWACLLLFQGVLLGFDHSFESEKLVLLHANVIYYTLCRFQKLSLPNTSETILLDFFEGWIIQPFSHIFARIIHIIKYMRTHIHSKQLKTVVFSLVILIPLVLFALSQLSAIDQNFAILTTSLFRSIFHPFNTIYFFRIIWSLPVGAYLFGLISSCILSDKPFISYDGCREFFLKKKVIPLISIRITNFVLLVLYLVFFIFQLSELPTVLAAPSAESSCIYAVRGFWNFFRIMGLNILLILVLSFLVRSEDTTNTKAETYMLVFTTICFNLLACLKLGLYFFTYGYTERRVIALWLLISILISLFLIIIRMHKKFNLIQFVTASFVTNYILFLYILPLLYPTTLL
ncbi:DUF4173 domain-containing protein [Solobacterium moorei]|uniref:DUF4153 domain-containing protein n=1 Tax=Solobacterium moorei TaxID=102148 RepID=UPI0024ACF524|nr:DUF4153 domain-containing protein [Solobacterium moorei]MDI6413972.1 DUF4173 domain-containing protein [Solobacterium moorei]